MRIMQALAKRAPEALKDRVRGTAIEKLFWSAQSPADTFLCRVRTPIGPINLQIHQMESWYDEKYGEPDGQLYEPPLIDDLSTVVDRETVFYDVGARWGLFSKVARGLGVREENIHALEADSFSFQILCGNTEDGENRKNVFVSDTTESEGNTISIDDYAQDRRDPDVMKIDIEGAELDAIRGAEKTISESRPRLYIEVHPEYIRDLGGTQFELLDELETVGYTVQRCADHREEAAGWVPIDREDLPDNGDFLIRCVS